MSSLDEKGTRQLALSLVYDITNPIPEGYPHDLIILSKALLLSTATLVIGFQGVTDNPIITTLIQKKQKLSMLSQSFHCPVFVGRRNKQLTIPTLSLPPKKFSRS